MEDRRERPAGGTPDPPASARTALWRFYRAVCRGGIALVASIVVGLLALRWYLSDERLRTLVVEQLTQRTGAQIRLESLRLELTSGLALRGFDMGPLPGFTGDTLAFERLAVGYSLWDLLHGQLTVDEIACTGCRVTLEEGTAGTNLDALLGSLTSPAPQTPPPAPPGKATPTVIANPALPLSIVIERLSLQRIRLEVRKPGLQLVLDNAGLEGHFAGHDDAFDAWLWVGLGARDGADPPSTLRLTRPGQPTVSSTQHVGFELRAHGLADVSIQGSVDVQAVVEDTPAPPVHIQGDLAVQADLLAQHLAVPRLAIQAGEGTAFLASASLRSLLQNPHLSLQQLRVTADFDALAPHLRAATAELELGGRASLTMLPWEASLRSLQNPAALQGTVRLALSDVTATMGQQHLGPLDLETTIASEAGIAHLRASLRLAAATASDLEATGIASTLELTTPIGPWLLESGAGDVNATLTCNLQSLRMPNGSVSGARLDARVVVPIAWAQTNGGPNPVRADLRAEVTHAEVTGLRFAKLQLTSESRVWDPAGMHLDTTTSLTVADASGDQNGATIELHDLAFFVDAQRRDDAITLRKMSLEVPDAFSLSLTGGVQGVATATPRLADVRLLIGPVSLGSALALLPQPLRPPVRLTGTTQLTATADGVIPLADLPEAPRPASAGSWEERLQTYGDILLTWAQRLDRGLPLTAAATWTLKQASVDDGHTRIDGLEVEANASLRPTEPTPTRPEVTLAVRTAHVEGPLRLDGLSTQFDLAYLGNGLLRTTLRAALSQATLPNQPPPLGQTELEAAIAYRVGGDLRLEKLQLDVAGIGLHATAEGQVGKPLRILATRAWEEPSLPGVSAELHGTAALQPRASLRLGAGDTSLKGGVGIRGELAVHDGIANLTGQLRCDHATLASGRTRASDIHGSLPLSLRLAFAKRPDAVVVYRSDRLKSGVVTLLTAAPTRARARGRTPTYALLRPYRTPRGLRIARIVAAGQTLDAVQLDGTLRAGQLAVEHLTGHLLGGDISGDMALHLAADESLRGHVAFKATHLDAATVPQLQLQPGPDSELSTDMHATFHLSRRRRDIALNMNVTQVGSTTFDRFLALLDPEGKDENIQRQRQQMWLFSWGVVRLDAIAMWIRYEKLNMDLSASSIVGYSPMERELLRRFDVSGFLDPIFTPLVDQTTAMLGWSHEP